MGDEIRNLTCIIDPAPAQPGLDIGMRFVDEIGVGMRRPRRQEKIAVGRYGPRAQRD